MTAAPHRHRARPRTRNNPSRDEGPALAVNRLLAFLMALILWPAFAPAQTGAPDPPARGPSGAVLEIIEFSDFQCPFCAAAKPAVDSLLAGYPGEVRLVYRHFPLPMHENAESAAIASIEADRQGAFWAYRDLLFAHQERLTDVDLIGYADSLGLDARAFETAIRDRTHADRVAADVEYGEALGVGGTPTFFVNGYRLVGGPPLWVFEEALGAFREGTVTPRPLVPPSPD